MDTDGNNKRHGDSPRGWSVWLLWLVPIAVAGAVFAVALDSGGYSLTSRHSLAILVLWSLVLGSSVGLWPVARIPRAAILGGSFLAAFAIWTGLSGLWAASAENAFNEFDRAVLYLSVFVLALVAAPLASARRWIAGLALGLTAVGLLALVSRLFPNLIAAPEQLAQIFPSAQKRLSYPVDYWNALATLIAFALPLLLYFAVTGSRFVRGLAVAPIPALAAAIYFTSSRGGSLAAILAVALFLVLTSRRWPALGAVVVAGLGSAAAIAVVLARDDLVDNPFNSSLAAGEGRSAALWIALFCLGVGLVYGALATFVPAPPRASKTASAVAAGVLIALLAVGLVAAHPVQRFEKFKDVPPELAGASVQQHLLSGSGNGRWQLWESAVDEFRTRPIVGRGAGSYEAWWAEHGTLPLFVRDAHSLFVETLGELGIVGLLLLLGFIGTVVVSGLARLRQRTDVEQAGVAALVAVLAAFVLEAGIDWMWELTVVGAVGALVAGLLTGPATATRPAALAEARTPRHGSRAALRILGATAALVLILAEAVPLLATMKVRQSQDAATAGNVGEALQDAVDARAIQPWAATPYLQVALAQELAGDIPEARRSIGSAIARDESNWRFWLVAARLEIKAGAIPEARRSLARAAELNPRSPLFQPS